MGFIFVLGNFYIIIFFIKPPVIHNKTLIRITIQVLPFPIVKEIPNANPINPIIEFIIKTQSGYIKK